MCICAFDYLNRHSLQKVLAFELQGLRNYAMGNGHLLANLSVENRVKYAKVRGKAGESLAMYNAMMEGYSCSLELSDSAPYDFILGNGGELYKVQVKSSQYCSWKDGGGITFTIVQRNSQIAPYKYVDIFAFVDLFREKIAWLRFSDLTNPYKITIKYDYFNLYPLINIVGETIKQYDMMIETKIDNEKQQTLAL